jgi:predicted nuclease of predicted toxin-antitoxin system
MPNIKFFLDEHIPKAVAKGLRSRGIEVLTCKESDRLTTSDVSHLQFCKNEGFVIVTADNDFLTLHSEGNQHVGIAFATRPLTLGQYINALLLIHEVLEDIDMINHVEFL